MIQTLVKNWWLLALCGILEAIYSAMNFFMQDPDGYLILRLYAPQSMGRYMCMLALAAGACTIAAGIWSSRKGMSWLLVLNGLALSAFGLIPLLLWTRPLSLRPFFALLLVVMAMSIGILALASARTLRHVRDKWFLGLAGATSVGFALAFFALDFRWIKLEQPGSYFVFLGSYFGLSAICMLGLGLHSLRAAVHRTAGNALPTG